MSQEDHSASELNHPEEILFMMLPANDDAAIVMQPSEQPFHLPPTSVTPKDATVLRRLSAANRVVRSDQFHSEALADFGVERIAVVGAIADQPLWRWGEEALFERDGDELGLMRRSAGHVHGERKTMAVADGHDFAALAASSRADGGAPFFAPLKLASMNASLRSSLPRSRKSSANFCSSRSSRPERCHCWKRR
jgi:hypothetical protein